MKGKKKNSSTKETQKRLFLRMKSPSAFGGARRFDSASFMNVPPEMARRDAAYACFSSYYRSAALEKMPLEERSRIYRRILQLFDLIEKKSEFIVNSDIIEKRNLEHAGTLAYLRLLRKYLCLLNDLVTAQMERTDPPAKDAAADVLSGDFSRGMAPQLRQFEEMLTSAVRDLLQQKHDLLLAQKEQRRKGFSKSDSERYERAYALYTEFYANLENV